MQLGARRPQDNEGKKRHRRKGDQRAYDRCDNERRALGNDDRDPCGKQNSACNVQQALPLRQGALSGGWNQRVIEPEHEQQNAADKV